MTRVYLGLGSNINPRHHLAITLDALSDNFGALTLSSVYESEAVGFSGPNFFNMVAGVDTALPLGQLSALLKSIEDAHGRDRTTGKYSGRTVDIDILTYGDLSGRHDGILLPRAEVVFNAFVLRPLAEVAATQCHPLKGISYEQMWREYESDQKLWPVDFIWRGDQISFAACTG